MTEHASENTVSGPPDPAAFIAGIGVAAGIDLTLTNTGHLMDRLGEAPCRVLFVYGELPVRGGVTVKGDVATVDVAVDLAIVPYSVESLETRKRLLALVQKYSTDAEIDIAVASDQMLRLSQQSNFDGPVTAAKLVGALVGLMLDLDPVLRTLARDLPDLA